MKIKRGKHIKTNSGSQKLVKEFRGLIIPFIKRKKTSLNFAKKQTTDPTKELRLLMYSDIDAMPMLKFMDCICDNNFNSLYKDTTQIPNENKRDKELEDKIFNDLYLEFLDRFFANDNSIFDDKKRIIDVYCKIAVIESIEQCYYRLKNDKTIFRILRKYNVILTDNDETNLNIISGAKAALIRKYEQTEQKMNKDTNEDVSENVNGWKRKTFIDLLSAISNFFDRQISVSLITVGEFCSLYQMMKQAPRKTPNRKQNYYGRNH